MSSTALNILSNGVTAKRSRVLVILFALCLILATAALLLWSPGEAALSREAMLTLLVFTGTLLGWTVLRLPETPVALAGALALILGGAVEEDALADALGHDITWLLIAAFVIGGVLRRTGLTERLAFALLARCGSVGGVFLACTGIILATAYVIPSTSARAAVLLPVFLGLSETIDQPRVTRALGLLFPSVILFSACASLLGAGAHLVAVDYIDALDAGPEPSFATWAALGLPFALGCSALACLVIRLLFLSGPEWSSPLSRRPAAEARRDKATTRRDRVVLVVLCVTVAFWCTSSWHGIGAATIALVAALLLASPGTSGVSFQEALKGIEWGLVVFLAASMVIGEALLDSGAAEWLVEGTCSVLSATSPSPAFIALAVAILSALAHLLVVSRTARAGVLIPALALPLGSFAEPAALILIVTMGSGFCQTLLVSAKPVTLFGAGDAPPFAQTDLLRLSLWLLPGFVLLLTGCALVLWPWLGVPLVRG
ncbi:SLC13 family permease [Pseudoroseomonas globiformis]|uniref:SLC13 family permease n=1 Tax=Teichococcus globiformis TaxID=2307229 RepID=A0ABV7G7R0_9PROT